MKVTEIPVELGGVLISSEQFQTRTPGSHVSSVVKYMSKSLRKDNDYMDADLETFATFGRIWEHHLSLTLFQPPRWERVGEIEKDGLIGSPDAIDTVDWAVGEFKAAWASCRELDEAKDKATALMSKFPWYVWQIKSYCWMLSMYRAKLIVAYLNGNWKPPKPCCRQYSLLFTEAELRQHWQVILENCKRMNGNG